VTRLPRVTAAELLSALHKDGWHTVRQRGSHIQLLHPTKPGRVTIASHSRDIIRLKTMLSILERAGLNPEELRRLL
jgi:predicted RNA binding protein YcfA (HicA-like mRNA interferase family)